MEYNSKTKLSTLFVEEPSRKTNETTQKHLALIVDKYYESTFNNLDINDVLSSCEKEAKMGNLYLEIQYDLPFSPKLIGELLDRNLEVHAQDIMQSNENIIFCFPEQTTKIIRICWVTQPEI